MMLQLFLSWVVRATLLLALLAMPYAQPTLPAPAVEPTLLQHPLVLLSAASSAPVEVVSLDATIQTSPDLGHEQIENGAFLTVTFTMSATANAQLTNATLNVTFTPYDALSGLRCTACIILTTPVTVPTPSGGSYQTVIESGVRYINAITPSTTFSFVAQLLGQPDGRIFNINALLSYVNGSGVRNEAHTTKPLTLTVRAPTQNNGQAQVLPYPSWRSPDIAGVFSQDWGDYDRDGDPDLALGFSGGARVYKNDNGVLTPVFTSSLNTGNNSTGTVYAVRWADVNTGGQMELLEAGGSSTGFLRIYSINSSTPIYTFTSDYPLAHLAIADFDGNGALDVVANNATFRVGCPVMIFTDTNTNGGCYQVPLNPTVALGVVYSGTTPYLTASGFNKPIKLFKFAGSAFTETYTIPNAANSDQFNFPSYDFAWGDFDHNGIPDLAAAFPLQHEVRIYTGTAEASGRTWSQVGPPISVDGFFAPLSVDWADVDGDGNLDLLVAGSPPSAYHYIGNSFIKIDMPNLYDPQGQIWSLRAAHMQPSRDPSFLAANSYQPSWLYDIVQPRLSTEITQTVTGSFHSIALGDVYADHRLDMVFGSEAGSTIVMSIAGNRYSITGAGYGPQDVALGDVNGNGTPDVAVGSIGLAGIYGGGSTTRVFTQANSNQDKMVMALADADGDDILDVASGNINNGPAQVFTHTGIMTAKPLFTPAPAWTAPVANGVRALAWADVDRDFYPDLLVVDGTGKAARLYRNSGNQTNANALLRLAWSHETTQPISAVAWGDANGDGRPDLALAEGNHIFIFESDAAARGMLRNLPSLTLELSATSVISSMAWGDWNNDGLPELAVADASGPVRVYANLNSKPGQLRLEWLWQAVCADCAATGVAWGDMNNDGYLDLGVSRKSGNSGIYINTTLQGARASAPPQIELHRPGITRDAGDFSSSEVLGGRFSPTVTLQLIATRQGAITNTPVIATYEFTRDGGKTWLPAAVTETQTTPLTAIGTASTIATLTWDLRNLTNTVAGIDVRFRASLTAADATGQPDAVAGRTLSPPFQAQGSLCDWPTYLSIAGPLTVVVNTAPIFTATVGRNQDGNGGSMAFTWNFGNGQPEKSAQWLSVNYTLTNEYTLTVRSQAQNCGDVPARIATASLRVKAIKSTMSAMNALTQAAQTLDAPAPDLPQVQGLNGQSDVAGVHLAWQPVSDDGGRYRVYRGKDGYLPALLAELPESQTRYAAELTCGAHYYVTTARGDVESLPSTTSYYAPACANPAALAQMQPQPVSHGDVSAADPPPNLAEPETNNGVLPLVAQPGFSAGLAWAAGAVLPKAFLPLVFKNNLPTEGPRVQCSVPVATTTLARVASVTTGIPEVVYADSVILDPVMSGDGGSVAFTSNMTHSNDNADSNLEIFAVRENSTLSVTHSSGNIFGGYNLGASISGDGTHVAFFSDRPYTCANCDSGKGGFNNFEIFVAQGVASTGTLAYTQVTSTSIASNVSPAISTDGQWVVFVSNAMTPSLNCTYCNNLNGNSQVYIAQLGAAAGVAPTITQLTNNDSRSLTYDFPVVSSGGITVAYVSTEDGTSKLWSGPPCSLSQVGGSKRERPYITSNGRIIVYATAAGQIMSNAVSIPNLTGSAPAISEDGTRLVYLDMNNQAQLVQLSVSPVVTQGLGAARYVGISADGKRVMTATESSIHVAGLTDLQVSVISSAAVAGSDYAQTVTIKNTGIVDAENVQVIPSFDKPKDNIFVSGSWTCSTCASVTVKGHDHSEVTFTGKLKSGFQGPFVTTYTVSTNTSEADETNNTTSIATNVIRQANLKVTIKSLVNTASVSAGGQINYEIDLTNIGPSDAGEVVLTSAWTGDASFTSSENCPNLAQSEKKITCTFRPMTANEHQTIKFAVTAGAKGNIVNQVDASSSNPTAQAVQEKVTTAIQPANLTIAHTVAPVGVKAGSQIIFTIKVQNDGPGIAQNVQVNSTLSAQSPTVLDSIITQPPTMCASSADATVNNSGFSATINQLQVGEQNSKTFNLCAKVKDTSPAPTTLFNNVSVSADTSGDVTINSPQISVKIAVTPIKSVSIICTANETQCSDANKITGQPLVFNAQVVPANATTPIKHEWSILSGTTTISSGNTAMLPHTFTAAGPYQVKLKVTGADDKSSESTLDITIALPPTPKPPPP